MEVESDSALGCSICSVVVGLTSLGEVETGGEVDEAFGFFTLFLPLALFGSLSFAVPFFAAELRCGSIAAPSLSESFLITQVVSKEVFLPRFLRNSILDFLSSALFALSSSSFCFFSAASWAAFAAAAACYSFSFAIFA